MSKLNGKYVSDSTIDAAKLNVASGQDYDFSACTIEVAAPTDPDQPVRKTDLDAGKWKTPVQVRAQASVTIAAPGATIDGETMVLDERVLCDLQGTATQDGIYLWKGAAVPMVRTDDAAVGMDFAGAVVFIERGTDADTGWNCKNNTGSGIIGTDDLTMDKFTTISDYVQEMHKVTSGEVTAGYFTLSASSVNAQSVAVTVVGGFRQVNKQCVGATGATPDFDVITPNFDRVHIANVVATGLSEEIAEDDILIIDYYK